MKQYDSIIKKELILISKKYDLKLLILFGSRANNSSNLNSDWDIAYMPSKNISINQDLRLYNDIAKLIQNEKVDLINIKNTKYLHVLKNIFLEGKLIYEKKLGLFKQLKWGLWMQYIDFSKYYNKELEISENNLNEMVKNG
jgi:predicted nucleotidyltransferase